MKKIVGFFFETPLSIDHKKEFDITLPSEHLYDGEETVMQSNRQVLEEIAKKYGYSTSELHNFFIISEITDVR